MLSSDEVVMPYCSSCVAARRKSVRRALLSPRSTLPLYFSYEVRNTQRALLDAEMAVLEQSGRLRIFGRSKSIVSVNSCEFREI